MDGIRILRNEIENLCLKNKDNLGLSNEACLMALEGASNIFYRLCLTEISYNKINQVEQVSAKEEENV